MPTVSKNNAIPPAPPTPSTESLAPKKPGFFAKWGNARDVFVNMLGYGVNEAFGAALQNWKSAESPEKTLQDREAEIVPKEAKVLKSKNTDLASEWESRTKVLMRKDNEATKSTEPVVSSPLITPAAKQSVVTPLTAVQAKRPKSIRQRKTITTQLSVEQNLKEQVAGLQEAWRGLQGQDELPLVKLEMHALQADQQGPEHLRAVFQIKQYKTLKAEIQREIDKLQDKNNPPTPSSIPSAIKYITDRFIQYETLHNELNTYADTQKISLISQKPTT